MHAVGPTLAVSACELRKSIYILINSESVEAALQERISQEVEQQQEQDYDSG